MINDGLRRMLDMPPEDLPAELDAAAEFERRSGMIVTAPRAQVFPVEPLRAINGNVLTFPQELRVTACAAAAPFIGRSVLSPDPRIRVPGMLGAIYCGLSFAEAVGVRTR